MFTTGILSRTVLPDSLLLPLSTTCYCLHTAQLRQQVSSTFRIIKCTESTEIPWFLDLQPCDSPVSFEVGAGFLSQILRHPR